MDCGNSKSVFLNMPLVNKRKVYKCGNRFKTVDDIVDWGTYVKTDEAKAKLAQFLVQEYSLKNDEKTNTDQHEADDQVNEILNKSTSADESKDDDKSVTCKDTARMEVVSGSTNEEKRDDQSVVDEDTSRMEVVSRSTSTNEGKSDDLPVVDENTSRMEIESETASTDQGKSDGQPVICEDTAEVEVLSEKPPTVKEKTDTQSATVEDVWSKKMKIGEGGATQSVIEKKFPKNDVLNGKISLFFGDITCLEIDAIVNAANDSLFCGGGVDNAIHTAAGYSLLRAECEELDGCDPGDAKITGGYKLPAKYVIHAVGPRGERRRLLRSCYKRSMELLKEHRLETIAFPCISTGIYGYPNAKAAAVVLETIRKWLDEDEYSANVKRIIFCLFLKPDIDIYHKLMPKYFPF